MMFATVCVPDPYVRPFGNSLILVGVACWKRSAGLITSRSAFEARGFCGTDSTGPLGEGSTFVEEEAEPCGGRSAFADTTSATAIATRPSADMGIGRCAARNGGLPYFACTRLQVDYCIRLALVELRGYRALSCWGTGAVPACIPRRVQDYAVKAMRQRDNSVHCFGFYLYLTYILL